MAHDKRMKDQLDEAFHEIDETEFQPEPGFRLEFEYDMIFNVHFRERWMKLPEQDLVSHAIEIERELYDTELNYQSIKIKDDSQTI